MKSSKLTHTLLLVAFGIATALSSSALGQAPVTNKLTKITATPAKASATPAKAAQTLSPYSGPIGDHIKLMSRTTIGANSTTAHVGDIGLKLELAQAYSLFRTKHEASIAQYFRSKGLYDVKVDIGGPTSQVMLMTLVPNTKEFRVLFRLQDSSVVGKVSKDFWFDPTLRGKFGVTAVLNFTTNGPALDPIVLKSSRLEFFDYRPDGDLGNRTRDFNTLTLNDGGFGKHAASTLNGLLRPYTVTRGLSKVTPGVIFASGPGVSAAKAIFELAPPPINVGQNVGVKAK